MTPYRATADPDELGAEARRILEPRPRLEPSAEKQEAARMGILHLYERAADLYFQHAMTTHGTPGEHDHHCICSTRREDTADCTCGWTIAKWAIERYEQAMLVSQKHASG